MFVLWRKFFWLFQKKLFPAGDSFFHPINIHSPWEICISFSFSQPSHSINQQKSYFTTYSPRWMQLSSVETPILCGRFDFQEMNAQSTTADLISSFFMLYLRMNYKKQRAIVDKLIVLQKVKAVWVWDITACKKGKQTLFKKF